MSAIVRNPGLTKSKIDTISLEKSSDTMSYFFGGRFGVSGSLPSIIECDSCDLNNGFCAEPAQSILSLETCAFLLFLAIIPPYKPFNSKI